MKYHKGAWKTVATYGSTLLTVHPSVYEASGENRIDATEIQEDKGNLN